MSVTVRAQAVTLRAQPITLASTCSPALPPPCPRSSCRREGGRERRCLSQLSFCELSPSAGRLSISQIPKIHPPISLSLYPHLPHDWAGLRLPLQPEESLSLPLRLCRDQHARPASAMSDSPGHGEAPAEGDGTPAAPAEELPCAELKDASDKCIKEKGEDACKELLEAYLSCLRALGTAHPDLEARSLTSSH